MKLTKKEKGYIYDRVKWHGYDLGSTKDFIVKLYFFDEEDYSEDVDGSPAAYYTSMNTLFNILADRGIKYKEVININEYLYVEFSSKEIYKYIKYDLYKGRKKKKLTPLERRLERESLKRLVDFFTIEDHDELNNLQPIVGRTVYVPEQMPPIMEGMYSIEEKADSIEKRIHVDEDGTPESADVRVKMTPENAMLAYIKGLAEFRKRQTGEDIRVVNEEGDEL